MLKKLKQSNKGEGFTIIEVMIVLAIAALILLIVLLAVPALQRSSRNTQRKNDVSAIAAAVANVITDNNGQVPADLAVNATDASSLLVCSVGGGSPASTTPACGAGPTENAKLGYYKPTSIYLETSSGTQPVVGTTAGATTITTDSVTIDTGYTCGTTAGTIGAASPRSAAIFYAIESGSSTNNLQCIEQ